ncbi:MAG: hypothetical protein JWP87_2380 [Labilithrix sp.]|nr:hypothetical protein [Labilithrix sp.]
MGTRYASLARCSDLSEREIVGALLSRDECAALLGRIAKVSSDRSASRSLLAVLARLATPACIWLEGELAVELFEEEGGTKVRVMSEIGAGLRERVLPGVTFAHELDALLAGFHTRRDLTTVLRLERVSARCALLLAGALRDGDEERAPMSTAFDISETSLAWPRAGHAAEDVDSGWG